MVNKVILVGGLVRDAESLAGSRGPVTRMRLATSTHWRDAEGNRHEASEFHSLVAFNRLAEICALYCLKGRRIYVEGRLRTREYEGNDGLRRTATEVVVEVMRLLDRREDGAGGDAHGSDVEPHALAAVHDAGASLSDDHGDAPAGDAQLAAAGARL